MGLDPWDAGPLRFSRVFDAFGVLSLVPLQQGRPGAGEMSLIPSPPLSCFVDPREVFELGRPYDLEDLPTIPEREAPIPCEEWLRRGMGGPGG